MVTSALRGLEVCWVWGTVCWNQQLLECICLTLPADVIRDWAHLWTSFKDLLTWVLGFLKGSHPKTSYLEAVSITIGCACGEDVSGHKLQSIMRYLNAYGRRSHQALQREAHALVALLLYYTAQFITNHKVTLRIPEKSAEFCRGQSHALKVGLRILINWVPESKKPARLTEHVLRLLTLFADFSGVFTVRSPCFPFFEGVLFIFGEWNLPFNFIVNEERWERSESRKTQKCVTGLG